MLIFQYSGMTHEERETGSHKLPSHQGMAFP